jgi:nicotinamidase-related amidase
MVYSKYDFILDKEGPKGISLESWLEKEKLALIIIDMQNYMIDRKYRGKYSANGSDDYYYSRFENIVLPNILKLIKKFRELRLKIIYTRIASLDKNHADVPGLSRKYLLDKDNTDTEGKRWTFYHTEHSNMIEDRIKPAQEDIVVLKTGSGAFCSSNMDLILRCNNISRLIFVGGLTDACVSSSVREAFDRGYLNTLVEDACITSTKEDHKYALKSLAKFYARVVDTKSLLSEF